MRKKLKIITCILLSLHIFYPVFSQTAKTYHRDSSMINNWPRHITQIPGPVQNKGIQKTLPVSRIDVKDVRGDTSYIGLQINRFSSWKSGSCQKIMLDQPASTALSFYLNHDENFQLSTSPYSLLCFIKEFRITQIDSINTNTNNKELYNRILLQTETFLNRNDSCYLAFRIDTILSGRTKQTDTLELLPVVLAIITEKCAGMKISMIEGKHMYQMKDLEERYRKKLKIPIITAITPEAGIYMSFDEFANNNPSIKKYKLEADRKSATLYGVSPQGELTLQTKAFGFCDGTNIWINLGNGYHPLIHQQDTFEFIGDYYVTDYRAGYRLRMNSLPDFTKSGSPVLGEILSASASALSSMPGLIARVVHQLNLQTGEIY